MARSAKAETLSVLELHQGVMTFNLLGSTPFLCNRMSQKVKMELLMPQGRKNKADRAQTLKHEPLREYRDSPYKHADDHDARLFYPGAAFKQAIATAALDMPGASKAEIGRLVRIEEYNVGIFGIPTLRMDIVRQAGFTRAPDVRTRACLGDWAAVISVRFAKPLLNEKTIGNLLAAAGQFVGVGDGRQEKGKLSCGLFDIVADDHPTFNALVKHGGRAAQDAALASPAMWDDETQELYSWFYDELDRRGRTSESTKTKDAKRRAKENGADEVIHD